MNTMNKIQEINAKLNKAKELKTKINFHLREVSDLIKEGKVLIKEAEILLNSLT